MLKLSHTSCRVDNLYEMAKQVQKMGFKIEWGSAPRQANNFFIWLGDGAFLEIFAIKKIYAPLVIFMKMAYGKIATKKWWHWFTAKNEWCDFALEEDDERKTIIDHKDKRTIVNIEQIRKEVLNLGISVSPVTLHWKRKNCRGISANYSYFIPENINLPFIVSRYEPAQKPVAFVHPNGARRLKYIKIEVCCEDWDEMKTLTQMDENIVLTKGERTKITEIGIEGLKKSKKVCNVILRAVED